MSKGSLLCSLVLVRACILQLCLISSCSQLSGGSQAGVKFLCQDPIGRPRLMSSHGREELEGHRADPFLDEELAGEQGLSAVGKYASDVSEEEEEEGWLPHEDGAGGAKSKSKSSSSRSGAGYVECAECGKFFKNHKSMFGHLRSHPNRGYKGATPPVNKLNLSPEKEKETVAASPSSTSACRGTHTRARRDGRLTPLELLCTYVLLTNKYPENSQPAPAPPSFCESETIVDEGTSNMAAAAEAHADEYGGSIVKIPKKRRNMKLKEISKEANRKKAKVVPPPSPPLLKVKGSYICKHCNAEFSTHQALGGHMAGHHRDKKVQTLNDASSRAHQGMAAQSQDGKLQGGGCCDDDGWRDSCLSLRKCLLCEQLSMASTVARQSGEASVGQMIDTMKLQHSRRSDGLTLAEPAPAQADGRGGRRLLDIDLNAEATEQE